MNSKHLLLLNRPFIEMSRKASFTKTEEEFSIWCIVNMSAALLVQNKTISFFLGANFLLCCRHKQKTFSRGIAPDPIRALLLNHM